uniref:Uncharacterized protein n=1 Tax=Quercus lobata TaxID=97700 RepID=A0A7N2MCF8_QUELO
MSLTVKKLAMSHLVSLNKNAYIRALSPWTNGTSRCTFSVCADQTGSEDGAGISHQEFQRWRNGGGTFPKSACIDLTVLIEMGAIVHPKSVVGAYVHIQNLLLVHMFYWIRNCY